MKLNLLLLLCSWLSVADDVSFANEEDDKQLIFFAGPHGTYENQIKTYLHNWNIHGWKWPKPNDERHKDHNLLDLLVTDPNSVSLDGMYNQIYESWQTSKHGMIIGSEFFDQIGPYAKYDAIGAMDALVETLSVPPKNVLVILNYRRTRIDQWISMWQKAKIKSYRNFMCDSQYDVDALEERMDMIGSQMNPLNAAYEYLEGGWNVKLIDIEGVHQSNRDVSHVIVCDILLGNCNADGLLVGHEKSRTISEQDLPTLSEELSVTESNKITSLFQYRECDFQKDLHPFMEEGKFEVLFNDDFWRACDPSMSHLYRQIGDDEVRMYEALLSQLECSQHAIFTMDQALGLGESSESVNEDTNATTNLTDPLSDSSTETSSGSNDDDAFGWIVMFAIVVPLVTLVIGITYKLVYPTKKVESSPISYKRRDKEIFDHGNVILETVLDDDSDYDEDDALL